MNIDDLTTIISIFCLFHLCSADLHQIKLYEENAFSSSHAEGNEARFAVDDDFESGKTTCFKSLESQIDFDGFHWFVLDIGITMRDIAEIRISPGNDNKNQDEIEVFVAHRLHTTSIFQTNPSFGSLPWTKYEFCNNTRNELLTENEAIVTCFPRRTGRWILLRRKTSPLLICRLIIQVDSVDDYCFESVEQNASVLIGNQFGQMRHISREQCRMFCAETPVCQTIQFVSRRRTRNCRLFHDFLVGSFENKSAVACPAESRCFVEKNVCHRGGVLNLTPSLAGNPFLWNIKTGNSDVQVSDIYAVQLEGRLFCRSLDCGLLNIYILDDYDNEYLCGILDTESASVLDRKTIDCIELVSHSTRPKAIKISHLSRTSSINSDEFWAFSAKIEGGYIRHSKLQVDRAWLNQQTKTYFTPQLYDEKQVNQTHVSSIGRRQKEHQPKANDSIVKKSEEHSLSKEIDPIEPEYSLNIVRSRTENSSFGQNISSVCVMKLSSKELICAIFALAIMNYIDIKHS